MLNLNNGGTINGGINNNRTMGSISVSDSTVNGGINNGNTNSKINGNVTISDGGAIDASNASDPQNAIDNSGQSG